MDRRTSRIAFGRRANGNFYSTTSVPLVEQLSFRRRFGPTGPSTWFLASGWFTLDPAITSSCSDWHQSFGIRMALDSAKQTCRMILFDGHGIDVVAVRIVLASAECRTMLSSCSIGAIRYAHRCFQIRLLYMSYPS